MLFRSNYVAAFKAPSGFSVFNVGSGKNYQLNTVARWICSDEEKIQYIAPRIEPKITLANIQKLKNMASKKLLPILELEEYIKLEIK